MSVDSPPLGATRGGTFELRTPALEARTRASRNWVGLIAVAGMMATGLLVALAAAGTDKLLPQTLQAGIGLVGLAGSFGAGINLGGGGLTIVMVVMFASYLAIVAVSNRLSPVLVLGAIAALHALMLLGPPLVSTDVFSYQFYGRTGAIYGANPYLAGPYALSHDPLYFYLGSKWFNTPTVYGPLFTALSYVLAPLAIPANVFAYKTIAAVSSLGIVALVWNGARLRGIDPVKAAALVGLNPLIVVYGVGGGHNDLLMLAPLLAGVVLLMQRRERLGAGAIVVAAAVKLTAAMLLPFAIAGASNGTLRSSRRKDLVIGAGAAVAALAAFAFVMFGSGPLHLPVTIEKVQGLGNWQSIPGFIGTRLGLGTVGHPVALILGTLFALILAWLVWRVWRGELDWIAGAGWATVALLLSAGSLLPWYVAWLMPLAALGGDRRLWRASIGVTCLIAAFQILAYIPHGNSVLGL
ncbi:MAG: polyprenol phosphomannose-dependent alpha 1,6 mannosyltransferase MptB [Solirubrobacterales bacterium]|nr:polyprenol phosphomannose-dependent alpha 1,6 mannosyltransferase MptB [Solirubrobacterales bacterium]